MDKECIIGLAAIGLIVLIICLCVPSKLPAEPEPDFREEIPDYVEFMEGASVTVSGHRYYLTSKSGHLEPEVYLVHHPACALPGCRFRNEEE